MTEEKPFNIHDYIEIGLRRKWYLLIPFVLSVVVSVGVYKYLPKIYKANTLILVQPQSVPESYVQSTVTESIIGRLNTISQEILSRTRLEKVIQEFNLYADMRKKIPMEEVVETMRKAIEVKIQSPNIGQGRSRGDQGQNTFAISFEGEEPRAVMMVANKLTSLFIEENLKVREYQAEGTSDFLSKELQAMEERLKQKEEGIRNFRERSMGQLPQQLDANLRILERLQQQLQTTSEHMRATEDRSVLLQNQIDQLKIRTQVSTPRSPRSSVSSISPMSLLRENAPEDPLETQLNRLKQDLESAQSKYKETHPDIIDLNRKIANLEPKVKKI